MIERDPNKKVVDPSVSAHLALLGARDPTEGEERALRALARGQASEGQQKLALRFMLSAGGAATLCFDARNERLSAFRQGSQAWAQALATIAGASWIVFRGEAAEGGGEDGC